MTEENANLHDRIDPELAEALAAVPKPNGRIFDLGNLEGTRELIRQMAAQGEPAAAANTAVLVKEHEASRPGDAPVPLRVFRPTNVRAALPAMLWFHGGGQVLGFAAQEDAYLKRIAGEVGCMVISVDYRPPRKRARPPRRRTGLPLGAGSAARRRRSARIRSGSPSREPAAAAALRRQPLS